MRRKRSHAGLSVNAISGTYVVMLGMDLDRADCRGLRGFAIHRTDHTEDEAYWMEGLKTFAETDPGLPAGTKFSTRQHPIQGFTWSDYSAKPGHQYTYRVLALKGEPSALEPAAEVSVSIGTESPENGDHDIYFNRGVAASQEYARRFGNRRPADVGEAALTWLSRGLSEAILGFIASATGPAHALRVAAYEFRNLAVLEALRDASRRGVDVHVVFDHRKASPGDDNEAAVAKVRISSLCSRRESNKSAIAHNKFIVRSRNGRPEAVLTGGTNFSDGGIFGHSNVVHVVEDAAVAKEYQRYWDLLVQDPTSAVLRPILSDSVKLPGGAPKLGTQAVFSPRRDLDALQYYAQLAASAKDGLFMTFAFGMHPLFQDVYRTGRASLRFAVMEKATRPMKRGPQRSAEEAKILRLRKQVENRFAIGSRLTDAKFDRWLAEQDSGLNRNVKYIHNKFMLIDPLGADPVVVAGSANFSEASSDSNDENMLIVRGNRRVAEIYLGEFLRLYNHHAFREFLESPRGRTATLKNLRVDEWWRDYFGSTARSFQRAYFAG